MQCERDQEKDVYAGAISAAAAAAHETQKVTFTRWANEVLRTRAGGGGGRPMGDVTRDLGDGTSLVALLEGLMGRALPVRYNARCATLASRVENVQICLRVMRDQLGMRLVNIAAEDVVRQDTKLVLGLVWSLILRFQLHEGGGGATTHGAATAATSTTPRGSAESGGSTRGRLLAWVNERLTTRQQEPVSNFGEDWKDGRALWALVCSLVPAEAVPAVDATQTLADQALALANSRLGVPLLVTGEEVRRGVDELSMMCWISYLLPSSKAAADEQQHEQEAEVEAQRLRGKVSSQEEEIRRLKGALAAKEAESQGARDELARSRNEVQQRLKTLGSKTQEALGAVEALRAQEREGHETTLQRLREKHRSEMEELQERSTGQLDAKDEDLHIMEAALQEQLSRAKAQRDEARASLKAAEDQLSKQSAESQRLSCLLEEERQRELHTGRTCDEKDSAIHELHTEVAELRGRAQELERLVASERESLAKQRSLYSEQLSSCQASLQKQTDQNHDLVYSHSRELSTLRASHDKELAALRLELEAQRQETDHRCRELSEQVARAKVEAAECEQRHTKQEEDARALQEALRRELTSTKTEEEGLRCSVSEQAAEVSRLTGLLEEERESLSRREASLEGDLREKDAAIAVLRQELAEQTAVVRSREDELLALREEQDRLASAMHGKQAEAEAHVRQLADEREASICRLQAELASLREASSREASQASARLTSLTLRLFGATVREKASSREVVPTGRTSVAVAFDELVRELSGFQSLLGPEALGPVGVPLWLTVFGALKEASTSVCAQEQDWGGPLYLLQAVGEIAQAVSSQPEEGLPRRGPFETSLTELRGSLFDSTLDCVRAELGPLVAPSILSRPPGEAQQQKKGDDEDVPSVLSVLSLLFLRTERLPSDLRRGLFDFVVHFVCATAVNTLLTRGELCSCTTGLAIKLNVQRLSDFFVNRPDVESCKNRLLAIREAASLLVVNQDSLADASATRSAFRQLTPVQILRLASKFSPDEFSPRPPGKETLSVLEDRAKYSQSSEVLMDALHLPE